MADPSQLAPGEAQIASGEAPGPTSTPPSPRGSPGAAFAGARVPGGPSLPDGDPTSLSLVLSRYANDLFSAPPVSPEPGRPAMASPSIPSVPSMAAIPSASAIDSAASPPPVHPGVHVAPGGVSVVPAGVPSASAGTPSLSAPSPSASLPGSPAVGGSPFDVAPTFGAGLFSGVVPGVDHRSPHASAAHDVGSFPDRIPLLDHAPADSERDHFDDSILHDRGYEPTATDSSVTGPTGVPGGTREIAETRDSHRSDSDRFTTSATPWQIEPITQISLPRSGGTSFDAHALRREFPILEERVNGKPLVWLDNAATTQKPRAVIERLRWFYEHENSNIHRAAHTLAARATDAYEGARETVRRFIHASSKNEIIFVRGTTEGINLIAKSYGQRNVREGDEIVVTHLEHHANIVPWQQLADEKKARLLVAPVDDRGQVRLDAYERLLGPKTRIVSFPQVSNALGTVTPAREMIALAHRHGAKVVLDGAQSISHMPVDVQELDCDFFVFSGHKVFAPTGIGAVFGKAEILEEMPPWQGGGNMIEDVTFERTTYQGIPARFEAGTANIADAVGLGAALDWLARVGVEKVGAYEHELLEYGTDRLATVPGLRMIGTAPDKAGVLSFVLAGQKTEQVGGLLDQEGIAVRSGHHCAQPILRRFGLEATVRASLAPYNTHDDLDALVDALRRLQAGHVAPRGA